MTPIHLRAEFYAYPLPLNPETKEVVEGAELRGSHKARPYILLSFYGEADAAALPPGTWEIVSLSKEVTEEVAKDIVDKPTGFITESYKDYEGGGGSYVYAMGSFNSLLRSKRS